MATVTLRPNGTIAGFSGTPVGGATVHAVTSDNSDASYVGDSGGGSVDMTTVAMPALSQVRAVTARLRYANTTALAGLWASVGFESPSTLARVFDSFAATGGTIVTVAGSARTTDPDGVTWSQATIDSMRVYVANIGQGGGTFGRTYELYADVLYNEAPVATVTVPAEASTITNDSTPDVSWTYSDPEADAQERYQVKVFSAAQFGAGGFDPTTSTATWDSGSVLSATTTATVGTILANAVYRAYVRVADVGSSGRFGAWDFNQFTLTVVPPPVPTLDATVNNTNKSVSLSASSSGAPAVEFMNFEYSDNGGVTWFPVRGGTRVLTTGGGAIVVDLESPPNTARQYRAMAGRLV